LTQVADVSLTHVEEYKKQFLLFHASDSNGENNYIIKADPILQFMSGPDPAIIVRIRSCNYCPDPILQLIVRIQSSNYCPDSILQLLSGSDPAITVRIRSCNYCPDSILQLLSGSNRVQALPLQSK
jgi:hypothetical protein